MKKLLKLFTAAMFACLLSVCFIACGKKGEDTNSRQESNVISSENSEETGSTESGESEHVCSFGDWYETTAAKCEEAGEERRDCVCGEFETRETEALTHSYTAYESNGDATCTEDGTKTATCDNGCGSTDILPDEGSAKGHSYTVYESNGDATCTEDGTKTATCDNGCGSTDILPDEDSAKGHDFVNGVCANCSERKPSEGLLFKLNEDKQSYAVTNIGSCKDFNLVIPSVYSNLPVTSIGDRAFYGCTVSANVTIPNSVTSIGAEAFCNWAKLKSINISESVTTIGEAAFFGCSELRDLKIPNGVTVIGKQTFYNCTSLISVTLSENVTSIGAHAFDWCESLSSIIIPQSVISIGEDAFDNCLSLQHNRYDNAFYLGNEINPYRVLIEKTSKSITSCTIHEETKIIHNGAFSSCSKLTNITIPSGIMSIGNDVFSGCSSLTEIVIPNGVTSIGNFAFYNCSSLTEIVIPDSLMSIGNSAFYNCSALAEIVIPNSVTSIDYKAFEDCSILTIYCEAENQPNNWHINWNPLVRPVVWGYLSEE